MIGVARSVCTVKELEAFWLEAVRNCGWQNKNIIPVETTEPLLLFGNMLYHQDTSIGLSYIDLWWNGPNDTFGGMTMIQRDLGAVTLWQMHYAGWIPEQETEFVRIAIRKAIDRGIFAGGRGETEEIDDSDGRRLYINLFTGNFQDFRGVESICLGEDRILAQVQYFGGMLPAPDPEHRGEHCSRVWTQGLLST